MSQEISRRVAAGLIALAAMTGSTQVWAAEALEGTKKLFEDAAKAVMGPAEIHKLSLYSTVQNYQVAHRQAMRSMLVTLEVSGRDALVFVCDNRPRFREAVLRAVTGFYRASRGQGEISEDEIRRLTKPIFVGYLHKDWLVKVDARFVKSANEAGPEVLKTRAMCKSASS